MALDNILDENGLPIREGIYLVRRSYDDTDDEEHDDDDEFEVYNHPEEGLCYFEEDHLPIGGFTGKFIRRLRDLE